MKHSEALRDTTQPPTVTPVVAGTLYGIGTGPGDPELLTLKAVRLLQQCPVVAYFCKRGGAGRARTICAAHLTPAHRELPLVYPVTTELPVSSPAYRERIEAFFDASAEQLAQLLAAGESVAVLNEGDPFFYGSFMHLHLRLQARFPATVIPGVGSIMSCGALLPRPLTMRDDVLTVIPGTMNDDALAEHLDPARATVIMKVGSNLPRIRHAVAARGLTERAWYVERADMPGQRVLPLAEVGDDSAPYFSMVLIPGPGLRQ